MNTKVTLSSSSRIFKNIIIAFSFETKLNKNSVDECKNFLFKQNNLSLFKVDKIPLSERNKTLTIGQPSCQIFTFRLFRYKTSKNKSFLTQKESSFVNV